MRRIIMVDDELDNVRSVLARAGYKVVSPGAPEAAEADAVVVAGNADDILGINLTTSPAPVIAARGLTELEILDQVRARLGPAEAD